MSHKTLFRCIACFCIILLSATLNPLSANNGKDVPWRAGQIVSEKEIKAYGLDNCFSSEMISDNVFRRMNGLSFRSNPNIRRSDLRYLRLLHYDGIGHIRVGEMVCNKAIAGDLLDIFRELFKARYPIERMVLIDNYGANDERSMSANNTTCFCYRNVSGSKKLSKHSLGMAVDINPLYNPHCKTSRNGKMTVSPSVARQYANRSRNFKYKIERGDLLYRLFIKHGFRWGGSWRHSKDYQHFEK